MCFRGGEKAGQEKGRNGNRPYHHTQEMQMGLLESASAQ